MRTFALMCILAVTGSWAEACPTGAQDQTELKGVLEHQMLENGVWIVRSKGEVFDLHGDLRGFGAGERVRVRGRVLRNRVCIHQVGVVFAVESIERAP